MNICCSEPTGHAPYALVFGQPPLLHFGMLEEWRLHNISMEEDLPEDILEDIASDVKNCNSKDTTSGNQSPYNIEQDCVSVS
jgi:hypothetical protein